MNSGRKAYPFNEERYKSILEAVEEEHIVSFEQENDMMVMTEMCDGYFRVALSKEQFGRFISALQELHDRM